MSYKTNPVGLRLKQTIGWKLSSFFIKNYTINVVLWLKIYLLLRAYLLMRSYKLLSCELRINEKFNKILYIHVLKFKKKRKKIYVKKNRLEKRRYNDIILGLYNQRQKFFKHDYLKNKAWIKNWSYLKYPLNKLNPWANIWWMQHIYLFFKDNQKTFKKTLHQFVQVKKSALNKHKVTNFFFKENSLTKPTPIVNKKYSSFFLSANLGNLLLRQKKLQYTYILSNRIFKLFGKISWKHPKYEYMPKYSLSLIAYLEFNRNKIKTVKNELRHLRKKINQLRSIINVRFPSKHIKSWKYHNLKSLQKTRRDIKTSILHQKFMFRAAIYSKLPTVWFSKLFETLAWKKKIIININQFILLEKFFKKNSRIKNMRKNIRYVKSTFRLCTKKIKNKKNTNFKKQTHVTKQNSKSKYSYRYKKKIFFFSIINNTLHNLKKKQKYVSYIRKHTPKFTHSLIKKKIAKYILHKKISQTPYQYKRNQLIKLSAQKKLNEKKFKINDFINVENFRLLSRLQIKYNIENWIKQYFNINTIVHVSLPIRHYKNLNWYRGAKKFVSQDFKKTIKKNPSQNSQNQTNKTYHYPLLNINNTGYLRKKIIKKKNSVYLIIDESCLDKTNIHGKSFFKQKGHMQVMLNRFLPLFSLFSTYFEPQLLADQIARELELTKSHRFLYRNLESILGILKAQCTFNFKVEIYGRFNSSVRSRKIYISRGGVIENSYKQRISYAFAQAYARIGCFGVKVWINF